MNKAFWNTKRVIVVLGLSLASKLWAFGDVGHMTVCQLGYELTSDNTKAAIKTLLGDRSFARQCTWPDQVKRVFKSTEKAGGPSDWRVTAGMHFVNYNDGNIWGDKVSYDVNVYKSGDMLHELVNAYDRLQDPNANANQKLCHLRFLGHLAGDSHQPLHVGRAVDFGGNGKNTAWLKTYNYEIRTTALDPNNELGCIEHGDDLITPDGGRGCVFVKKIPLAPVNLHMIWDDTFLDLKLALMGIQHPLADGVADPTISVRAFGNELMRTARNTRGLTYRMESSKRDDFLSWVEYSNALRPMAYDQGQVGLPDSPVVQGSMDEEFTAEQRKQINDAERKRANDEFLADLKSRLLEFKGFGDLNFLRSFDNDTYYKPRMDAVGMQIVRGGYHLAGMLNRIFDPQAKVNDVKEKYFEARMAELRSRIKVRRQEIAARRPELGGYKEFSSKCDSL